MDILTLRLEPLAAFGTALLGDTLFGQLCWAVRHRYGETHLTELLDGYTSGRPFAVVSDAFPAGYLPRPALPLSRFDAVEGADHKRVKKRRWLPLAAFSRPVAQWLAHCVSDAEVVDRLAEREDGKDHHSGMLLSNPQAHNTIDRTTGTTGPGEFAPYALMQHWYTPGLELQVRVVFDPQRIGLEALCALFDDIGAAGYGRDASIGLGKFHVRRDESIWPAQPQANTLLTLAPCAPQGMAFDAQRSFYQVFTRFGRHGDMAVHGGNPFKTPVLMASAGALLTPQAMADTPFVGQRLGGAGTLSKSVPGTVQQGFAPCVPVRLPEEVTA
jgi:CRISPR-associated protein Csm4